jgi:Mg/Co/Ni transporter MgtE
LYFLNNVTLNRNDIFDSRCTVVVTDQSNNIQGYLAYELIIPANATVELFQNVKHIPANFKIRAQATVANKIDLIYFGRRTNPII